MKRPIPPILAALAAGALVVAPTASPADYALANGAVKFSAPDTWPVLMESSEGPHQFVALQVKSPDNSDALARITVRAEQVDGLQGFQQFLNDGTARARKLPGYTGASSRGDTSEMRYSAVENHVRNDYSESYAYRSNVAIQVRCVRPADAPADWKATFDAGCKAIVTTVEK